MKFKQFISSTGFKSVVVLLVICLVCVALLAVLSSVLNVSDEEMFDRAMKKIYDKEGVSFVPASVDSKHASSPYGSVSAVTMAKEGNTNVAAVVEATGINGYAGTITCYVVINNEGKIEAWSIKGFTGETLMSSFGNKQYSTWYIGADVSDEIAMDDNFVSGVTMSSRAINNAINAAGYYSRNALGFGKNPQAEALEGASQLLEGTAFADVELAGVPKAPYNHLGSDLTYVFSGTKGDDTVLAFAYTIGGKYEYIVIHASYDDAVRSAVLGETSGITADIKDAVTANYFNAKARIVDVSGGVYEVIGHQVGMPTAYTLLVTIDATGVTAISIKVDGFVPGDPSEAQANVLATALVGATLANIDSLYNSNKVTGATNSADIIYNAVLTALHHYAANNG